VFIKALSLARQEKRESSFIQGRSPVKHGQRRKRESRICASKRRESSRTGGLPSTPEGKFEGGKGKARLGGGGKTLFHVGGRLLVQRSSWGKISLVYAELERVEKVSRRPTFSQ